MLAVRENVADMSDACLFRFGLFAMAGGAVGSVYPQTHKFIVTTQAQEQPA